MHVLCGTVPEVEYVLLHHQFDFTVDYYIKKDQMFRLINKRFNAS